jgi:hypothetical protein
MKRVLNIKGVDFEVTFDYAPEEKTVMYYADGSGYPGSPESIDNIHIEHKGTDFDDFFGDNMEMVEVLIWQSFEEE